MHPIVAIALLISAGLGLLTLILSIPREARENTPPAHDNPETEGKLGQEA